LSSGVLEVIALQFLLLIQLQITAAKGAIAKTEVSIAAGIAVKLPLSTPLVVSCSNALLMTSNSTSSATSAHSPGSGFTISVGVVGRCGFNNLNWCQRW